MNHTPLNQYEHDMAAGLIQSDAQQRRAIEKLNVIFEGLESPQKGFFKRRQPIKGLYLWGSVGIGKTYLMDLFYNCVSAPKMRQHFFNFMLNIHQQLREKQGQKNPLQHIAQDLAARARLICFDEFFVNDIADAMLLGELFKALFERNIILVTTSNRAPDDLYKDGLQRERFLPAIAAIKAHTDVMHLTTQHDYRSTQTPSDHHILEEPLSLYFFPLDDCTERTMQRTFDLYNQGAHDDQIPLILNLHTLPVLRKSEHIVWCRFHDLCEDTRSHNDYIALAKQFHTVLIDGVTPITNHDRKTILRFVHLIDILYDAQVRVVISASVCAADLYRGAAQFEFERTLSRLIEMQSPQYFNKKR